MKIAIQGHSTRGKEVIQLLESLGGINTYSYLGNSCSAYYELHGNSITCMCTKSDEYKYYTLEEFEKEFPFKVGDKVIHKEFNDFFEVVSFDPESPYPYKIKGVCEFNTKSYVLTKWQPKMKEERNITLTLDKAKEWYKKGGELKEIALQAFSEKELTKVELPRSWEEFCRTHDIMPKETVISGGNSNICSIGVRMRRDSCEDRNTCPSQASAEAHLAMIQLEQLRDCWRQGWVPNWLEGNVQKYIIQKWRDRISIETTYVTHSFLSFPTRKMAEEFLECFKDLIEKAGDLI